MGDGRWRKMEGSAASLMELSSHPTAPQSGSKLSKLHALHALRDIRLRLCRLCCVRETRNPNRAHPNRPPMHGGWSLELGISLRFEAWCLEFRPPCALKRTVASVEIRD